MEYYQNEIASAKQYNEELDRSQEYVNLLLSQEPGQVLPVRPTAPDESLANPPSQIQQHDARPTTNGMHRVSPLDPTSPFTQPPAPPPSQPLPEKPDSSRSALPEAPKSALQSLLRAESERPRSSTASQGSSPLKDSTGDIANLVTALHTAQKQIESQSQEVESLKTKLQLESTARQLAEVQAKQLLEQQLANTNRQNYEANRNNEGTSLAVQSAHNDDVTALEPQTSENGLRSLPGDLTSNSSTASSSTPDLLTPSSSTDSLRTTTTEVDASTSALQNRLEAFTREIEEMKRQMERYRQRAESAEGERSSLLEMIERLRAENERGDNAVAKKRRGSRGRTERDNSNVFTSFGAGRTNKSSGSDDVGENYNVTEPGEKSLDTHISTNGKVPQYNLHQDAEEREEEEKSDLANMTQTPSRNNEEATAQEIRDAMATILKNPEKFRNQRDLMGQAGPYASMLGVVLIGVGLMTWLNGWQKVER